MTDISAVKARLSDPREVAALLGLRVEQKTRNGVLCWCPVHGNKSGSLWLRYDGGKLRMQCFGCGIYGDAIDLLVAMEGDYKAGLARAEAIAGGSSGKVYVPESEVPRLDVAVYHTLAERILDVGKLDGRPWVREVEGYLEGRRMLELARADGWACLPGLKWLLQIAEEVCDGKERRIEGCTGSHLGDVQRGSGRSPNAGTTWRARTGERCNVKSGRIPHGGRGAGRDGCAAHDLLVAADLARYDKRGELVPTWGRWRLVIPWRGPDGRITSLQRRRTWEVPKGEPEPAKYVFPRGFRPEWPYGSERVGEYGRTGAQDFGKSQDDANGVAGICNGGGGPRETSSGERRSFNGSGLRHNPRRNQDDNSGLERQTKSAPAIAIVEGAVDVLAMRALHPNFAALGLPGIGGWRSDWAKLVEGANLRICLDRGKPDPHGVIPEDRASARIALDVAQASWQMGIAASGRWGSKYHGDDPWQRVNDCGQGSVTATGGRGSEAPEQSGASVFSYTERVLEWMISRHRRGRALFCVLCGREEAWLCRECGRRRAPEGMDWAGLWEATILRRGQ